MHMVLSHYQIPGADELRATGFPPIAEAERVIVGNLILLNQPGVSLCRDPQLSVMMHMVILYLRPFIDAYADAMVESDFVVFDKPVFSDLRRFTVVVDGAKLGGVGELLDGQPADRHPLDRTDERRRGDTEFKGVRRRIIGNID